MPRPRQAEPLQVIVQGRHVEVAPDLRRYVERKLGRLRRHFDQITQAQVVLSHGRSSRGQGYRAEVTIWGDGVVLRGEQASTDVRASVDGVVDKLEKQVARVRSRLIRKRRIDAARTKQRRRAASEAALRGSPTELPPEVVRTKRFALKPMTVEEAMMQLELLGHDFFVFRRMETGEVNVLYRRRAGDYGLIAPE